MSSLAALLLCLWAVSADAAAATFGTIDAASESATVVAADGRARAANVGEAVLVGERVDTGADGEVHVATVDDGFVAVRPNSQLRVDAYQARGADDDTVAMSLLKGALRSITGWIGKHKPSSYRLATATATIGIRGTDHEVAIVDEGAEPGTYLSVSEGEAVLTGEGGPGVGVAAGKHAFAGRDRRLAARLIDRLPAVLERRNLRLEGRIAERKARLLERIRERLEARRDTGADDGDDADDAALPAEERQARERRRALKRDMRQRLRERRN